MQYKTSSKQWQTVISAFLFMAIFSLAAAAQASASDPRKILILGDSLSSGYGIDLDQGWVKKLESRIADQQCTDSVTGEDCVPGKWSVVNASISGETIGGGLRRLPRLLERTEPDVVVVELGGNDGLRGYPVQRMRLELEKLIELAKADGAHVLLVGMMIPPNYGPAYSEAFAAQYADLAKSLEVPLVPFLLDNVVFTEGYMQQDRIHPTVEAQPQILDNVWPELRDLLREVGEQESNS
ncbi:arylesterase [Allohahella marinimesophila]|uniref:Arylesterase n=1 Tax=Allohahella marinimesophila TaxID=1054972 RepID=A0ABP7NNG5_9GAMM